MFCKHCGSYLDDNASFCVNCGNAVNVETPTANNEVNNYTSNNDYVANDYDAKEKSDRGGSIMTFGILSIVFGGTMFLSLLGLIFAIVARSKLGAYVDKFGEPSGRAKVGKYLSLGGLIYSIVMLAFLVIYILYFILIFALLDGDGSSYYYY